MLFKYIVSFSLIRKFAYEMGPSTYLKDQTILPEDLWFLVLLYMEEHGYAYIIVPMTFDPRIPNSLVLRTYVAEVLSHVQDQTSLLELRQISSFLANYKSCLGCLIFGKKIPSFTYKQQKYKIPNFVPICS